MSSVTDVVLTHNHSDHTGGLIALRRELATKNPRAMSRAHVGSGIFAPRPNANGSEGNGLLPLKSTFEGLGGVFVEHASAVELLPGVWLTGPVPRPHPERNWGGVGQVKTATGMAEDTIPEDMSIVVDTEEGLIVVSGCGHAGMVNTLDYAQAKVRAAPVLAAMGGFHLLAATDSSLQWTSARLREAGLRYLLGAHCTGIEAVYRLRSLLGLPREAAVVGAVGSSLQWGKASTPWLWPGDRRGTEALPRRPGPADSGSQPSGMREAFALSQASNDWSAGFSARATSGERLRRNSSPRMAWCSYMLPMSSAPGKPRAR